MFSREWWQAEVGTKRTTELDPPAPKPKRKSYRQIAADMVARAEVEARARTPAPMPETRATEWLNTNAAIDKGATIIIGEVKINSRQMVGFAGIAALICLRPTSSPSFCRST